VQSAFSRNRTNISDLADANNAFFFSQRCSYAANESASVAEVAMHCVYCGVDYEENETCLCLPPVRAGQVECPSKPAGVWGEADFKWSVQEYPVRVAPFINLV
jgi:hypothetical protein